jgi:hypothetical protein
MRRFRFARDGTDRAARKLCQNNHTPDPYGRTLFSVNARSQSLSMDAFGMDVKNTVGFQSQTLCIGD